MEKRDIQVNYDMLEVLLGKLARYKGLLERLHIAIAKVNSIIITSNDAESIGMLEKRYKKA